MEIKPVDRSVKQLLDGAFYKVPRFQRPYSWDRENVEEFWNDAVVAEVDDYFIGSFVVYQSPDQYGPLYVVDGQQRLTTITLLLAAVRDALDRNGLGNRAKGVQQLIERYDLNSELHYVLQTETSYPYLQEHIQKHGTPTSKAELGDEEEALRQAYEFLKSQLQKQIDVSCAKVSTADKKKKAAQACLERVRDQVLRLQLILITLAKEDEAYLIFETLNTRGKDLGVSDLVKNHLARLIRPKNKGVDTARDQWNALLAVFENSRSDIDINRFLHHAWLSRHAYIGEKQLFAEVRKTVTATKNPQAFLDQLESDAAVYRAVFEPDWHKWTKQESELFEALSGLQLFRVMQPAPMMLAILRAYLAKELSLAQARGALRMMENFHFQFTAMTAQRTGGGTGKMYASYARALSEADSKDKRGRVLAEFRTKLRERVPSEAEFAAGFLRLSFSETNTKQKSLVRYALMRVDGQLHKAGATDYRKMTIEHIAPQNPTTGSAISRVAEIGNLILVSEKLNGQELQNRTFADKKARLQKANTPMDSVLENASKWGDAEIDRRGQELAHLAYTKIFVV